MIDCGGVRGWPPRRGGGEQRSANQGDSSPFYKSLVLPASILKTHNSKLITNLPFFVEFCILKSEKSSRLSSLVSRLADER